MALYLSQHGISLPKDQDPEKGLSQEGKKQTALIARVAKNYEVPVSKIVHSGLKRAEQTALIYHDVLLPGSGPETIEGIAPLDDVELYAPRIKPGNNLMVVGHLPFLDRLVSYLAAGDQTLSVYRFQNSGIVCLDFENNNWFIKWTLNPNIS